MSDESILVIGSGSAAHEAAACLTAESFSAMGVDDISELSGAHDLEPHQVIVLDADALSEPPWRAIELLRQWDAQATVIVVVTPESHWSSFSSFRQRPAGIVLKPIDRAALLMAIDSALVYRRLLEENKSLKRQLGSAVSLGDWVGCTPQSQETRASIATAALSNGPVTICGEQGVGRRLAAELIHRHGRNPGSTFLPMDLTSLPDGELRRLLDEARDASERGRGTYVHGARPGTLYLAELSALSRADQLALKGFLEEPAPFRVMASSHPSITSGGRRGELDPELVLALGKIRIEIPALRERRGDVPVLIDHFLKRFCARFELKALGIPPRAIDNYSNYDWPGNVAELSMMIERAVSIASAAKFDGTTLPEHFCAPPSLTAPAPSRLKNASLRELIADIEKRIIVQTLERVDGSQKRAAKELRVNPTTLHEKMKRYNILPERSRPRA